jgi:ABC-type transporter Mla MlaB component
LPAVTSEDYLPKEYGVDLAMSESLSITVEEMPDGARTLHLAGEASVFQAAELHRVAASLGQEKCDVRLECGDLQSIDMAAGQILLALQRAKSLQGQSFSVTRPSKELAGLFEMVGLEQGVAAHDATAMEKADGHLDQRT